MADFAAEQKVGNGLFGAQAADTETAAQQSVAQSFFGFGSIPGAIPAPPASPVEVLMITPAQPGPIEPDQVVMFDVRSLQVIQRVVVTFTFEGLAFREVAFEGVPAQLLETDFEEAYRGTSRIEPVTDGLYYRYRFTLLRLGGVWPGSPQLGVIAYNVGGLEA